MHPDVLPEQPGAGGTVLLVVDEADVRATAAKHLRELVVRQPTVVLLLAVPILIQLYFNAGLAYWLNRRLGSDWCVPAPRR